MSRSSRHAPARRVFVNWWWVLVGVAELALAVKFIGGLFVASTYASRVLNLAVLGLLVLTLALVARRELAHAWAVAGPGWVSASGVGSQARVHAVALVPTTAAGQEIPVVLLDHGWTPIEPLAARAGARRHALFVFALGGTRGVVRLAPRAEVTPAASDMVLRAPRRWWHRASVAPVDDPRWRQ